MHPWYLQLLLALSLVPVNLFFGVLPSEKQTPDPFTATTKEDIAVCFADAMSDLTPSVELDISQIEWQYGPEIDLKNVYYSILSAEPELKYTYDMEVSLSENGTAQCGFSYMPYRTGAYRDILPAGSHTVGSLHDAKVMAQSMIDGTERLPIAITDSTLAVDDIQRALSQAGYGWIHFQLNRDGTEIVASPSAGKTLEECAAAINESFQLAGNYLKEAITSGMTEREKIEALYDVVTQNVAYDFRYYTDLSNMPYESRVALGALRDHLAICGGYAQAFETLLDMAGIENYTVSGTSSGEYHMWNYVILNGEGYYCDPTADRGGSDRHFMLTAEAFSAAGRYTWDQDFLPRMAASGEQK